MKGFTRFPELLSMKHFLATFARRLRRFQARKPAGSARRCFRPRLEALEERAVPTTLPSGFQETLVAGGLGSPTAMTPAPDGRVFITTQGGDLRVVKNGALLPTPFLHVNVDSAGERGLLGVAFDPNFSTNHFLYVYYTVPGTGVHNRVSRFTADPANPDVAAAGSEQDLLDLDPLSSATNHNGGAMHFGSDGKLYVAVGENANAANSQTLGNLLGKVLRLDVSQVAASDPANSPKLIPADNPFVGQAAGINQLIDALGFRNPFTFAVQPGSGTIFVNDVGQSTWEEIDRLTAGDNYGWNKSEGFASTVPPAGLGPGTYQDPQLAYNHSGGPAGGGIAIVGGAFYNPPADAANPFPSAYTGKYFYADLGGNWIRVFDPAQPGSLANPDTSSGFATGTIGNPVDLAVAGDGGLYYLARGSGGELLKISFTQSTAPTVTQPPQDQTVTAGEPATFSVTASGTAPLSYQWQRDNGAGGSFADITGATSSTLTVSNTQAADSGAHFRVVVSNAGGSVTSSAATLTVTDNQPPSPTITITGGLRNGKFDAGTPVSFTLAATDPEDGTEPPSQFTYQVDYVTSLNSTPGGVVRPFVPATSGQASGSFTPATSGPYTKTDVVYRVTFTVTDSGGRSTTTTQDVAPDVSTITLQTSPTGLALNVDGQSQTAPTSFASVVGFQRLLDAPATQIVGATTYKFGSWSDGGAASHTITTAATNASYTATYQAAQPFVAHINFTSSTGDAVAGYVKDVGLAYGAHGGLTFGWNQDNTANARDRNSSRSPDELHDSLNHLQKPNNPNALWEIAVPNGTYQVHVLAGDPTNTNSTYVLNAEGVQVVKGTPTSSKHWFEGTVTVTVSDGRLTISNGTGAKNNKIDAIDITQVSSGASARATPNAALASDLGPLPGTKPPASPGNGQVPGVPLPGGGALYYARDALLDGFTWFAQLHGWFPSDLPSQKAVSPGHEVVDMAIADHGTMTFQNVEVSEAGMYRVTFRYAFSSGFFPGVEDREMGLSVNGRVAVNPMHFPITGSFETYREAIALVPLEQGKNVITLLDLSEHGVARVDTMTVTPT
jgi:glucose/arabinose dehydrogenase